MTDAPEQIWAWSFNDWANWGGYARPTNMVAMNEKERRTGAGYTRTDIAIAREKAAFMAGMLEAAEIIQRVMSSPEAREAVAKLRAGE